MAEISSSGKKTSFSLLSYETEWTKTVDSFGNERITYDPKRTDKAIDYILSGRVFRIDEDSYECLNPLSALVEIADVPTENNTKEYLVQLFFRRFGYFTNGYHCKISHQDIVNIAYHYKLLLIILREYYSAHKNYAELFCKCVEYYFLHSLFRKSTKFVTIERKNDEFHDLFKSFPIVFDKLKMEEIEKAEDIRTKCEITESFLTSSTKYSVAADEALKKEKIITGAKIDITDYKIKSARDIETLIENHMNADAKGLGIKVKGDIPDICQLMSGVYEKSHYYISDGKVFFENETEKEKGVESYKKLIRTVATTIIRHAIGGMSIKVEYNVEEGACHTNIDNLLSLIDYSLMITDHREYGYYPCSNPKCSHCVLRRRPEKIKIEGSKQLENNRQSHFCSQKCARRIAQKNYQARQK